MIKIYRPSATQVSYTKIEAFLNTYNTHVKRKWIGFIDDDDSTTNPATITWCEISLNNSPDGISFAQDSEGNWGYIPSGADTVIPFKTGNVNDFYGYGSNSSSWTVNIKRNSNILKITGAGYNGTSANQTLKLLILGVSDENNYIPYHLYNGSWLPTISTITLNATLATQEIDVSAYPRLVLYVQYGSASISNETRIYFHIEN